MSSARTTEGGVRLESLPVFRQSAFPSVAGHAARCCQRSACRGAGQRRNAVLTPPPLLTINPWRARSTGLWVETLKFREWAPFGYLASAPGRDGASGRGKAHRRPVSCHGVRLVGEEVLLFQSYRLSAPKAQCQIGSQRRRRRVCFPNAKVGGTVVRMSHMAFAHSLC